MTRTKFRMLLVVGICTVGCRRPDPQYAMTTKLGLVERGNRRQLTVAIHNGGSTSIRLVMTTFRVSSAKPTEGSRIAKFLQSYSGPEAAVTALYVNPGCVVPVDAESALEKGLSEPQLILAPDAAVELRYPDEVLKHAAQLQQQGHDASIRVGVSYRRLVDHQEAMAMSYSPERAYEALKTSLQKLGLRFRDMRDGMSEKIVRNVAGPPDMTSYPCTVADKPEKSAIIRRYTIDGVSRDLCFVGGKLELSLSTGPNLDFTLPERWREQRRQGGKE